MTTQSPEIEAAGVEPDQIDFGYLAKIVTITGAFLLVIAVVLTFWFKVWIDTERDVKAANAVYPEMVENRLAAHRLLESYGTVDPEIGAYRIPVDRAMQLMLEESVLTSN